MNSDHLTALGAVAWWARPRHSRRASIDARWLALVPVALAVNWFGDSLDGTVARVRNQQRPRYGYYLDHVVDIANTAVLFTRAGAVGTVQPLDCRWRCWSAICCCAASRSWRRTRSACSASRLPGVGPTELRILLSAGALAAIVAALVRPFGLGPFQLFDVGGLIGAIGMGVVFVLSSARNTRALYLAEPLPRRTPTTR